MTIRPSERRPLTSWTRGGLEAKKSESTSAPKKDDKSVQGAAGAAVAATPTPVPTVKKDAEVQRAARERHLAAGAASASLEGASSSGLGAAGVGAAPKRGLGDVKLSPMGYMSETIDNAPGEQRTNGAKNDAIWEKNEAARQERLAREADTLTRGIESLEPGEKMVSSSKGGLDVQVPKLKVVSAGAEYGTKLEVERLQEKDKKGNDIYRVTSSGEGGAKASAGVDVGSVGVGGSGSVSGESKTEYEFKTKEDASRAAKILNGGGPKNEEERRFLEDHMTSQEYTGKVAQTASAQLPAPNAPALNGTIEAKGEAQSFIKYNYKRDDDGKLVRDKDGNPVVDTVDYGTRMSGEIKGKGNIDAEVVNVDTGHYVGGQGEIEQKTTLKVPEGANPNNLPALSVNNDGVSHETTIKLSANASAPDESGNVTTKSVELETKIRNAQPEKNPDGTPYERKPTVEVKKTTSESYGSKSAGGVDWGPVSVSYEAEEVKVKKTETSVWSSS